MKKYGNPVVETDTDRLKKTIDAIVQQLTQMNTKIDNINKMMLDVKEQFEELNDKD